MQEGIIEKMYDGKKQKNYDKLFQSNIGCIYLL